MWPVLAAALAFCHRRNTSCDAISATLLCGCHILVSTPPTLISAASISCAVSSAEEGDLLATRIHQLAAEHRLIATVTVTGKRLRARFTRADSVGEMPNGAR
jgi:hypothetical protein